MPYYLYLFNIDSHPAKNCVAQVSNILLSNVCLRLKDRSCLTHCGREKMDAISQTTFSLAVSSMKIVVFWLNFHWNMFARAWKNDHIAEIKRTTPNVFLKNNYVHLTMIYCVSYDVLKMRPITRLLVARKRALEVIIKNDNYLHFLCLVKPSECIKEMRFMICIIITILFLQYMLKN